MDDARIYETRITERFRLCWHLSMLHGEYVNDRKQALKLPWINVCYKSEITRTDYYTFASSCEQFQTNWGQAYQ